MSCDYCKNLNQSKDLLLNTKYWKVYLNPDQAYLGRCKTILKRHVENLSELNIKEWEDFLVIIKKLEKALKKTFDSKMFNWTFMMNDAYLKKVPQPHVHWHFRPRYNKKINLFGIIFEDIEFGKHYDRARRQKVSEYIRKKIITKIKNNIT